MINLSQARELIIRPAIKAINLWSPAAENLLVGTMLIESNGGQYVKQYPTGPALGPYQHEPKTHDDEWDAFLNWQPGMTCTILDACGFEGRPDANELIWNWRYATIMCRIHYYRAEPPLPDANDIRGLGEYWKQFWNTPNGKGRVDNYVQLYNTHHQK